jgi:hypothetical protein
VIPSDKHGQRGLEVFMDEDCILGSYFQKPGLSDEELQDVFISN